MNIAKNIVAISVAALMPNIAVASEHSPESESFVKGNSVPYYQAVTVPKKTEVEYVQYFGVKAGMLNTEADKAPKFDEAGKLAIYAGITYEDEFGVELEHSVTPEVAVTSKINGEGEFDVANYGAFVTYRHNLSDALYLKSRVGLNGVDLTQNYAAKNISKSQQSVGLSGGMRVGFDVTPKIALEGEYNLFNSKKISTTDVAVGAVLKF